MNSPEEIKKPEGCIATTEDAITSANVDDGGDNLIDNCDPNEIITVIELDETLEHKDKVSTKGKHIF